MLASFALCYMACWFAVEYDRASMNKLAKQRRLLQNGFTGHMMDAKSSVPADKDMIVAEVVQNHSVAEVDRTISLPLEAGLSTGQMRRAQEYGVRMPNQSFRILPAVLVGAVNLCSIAVAASLDSMFGVLERVLWIVPLVLSLICWIMYLVRLMGSPPDQKIWVSSLLTRLSVCFGLSVECIHFVGFLLTRDREDRKLFARLFLGSCQVVLLLAAFIVVVVVVVACGFGGVGDVAASSPLGPALAQFLVAEDVASFRNCWMLLPKCRCTRSLEVGTE